MARKAVLAAITAMQVFLTAAALAAHSSTPEQVAKRFPWDTRPASCLATSESPKAPSCKAPDDWPDFAQTKRHIDRLWMIPDFDLIERAANEVALSKEQFASGRYRFESWILSMEANFQYTEDRSVDLVKRWSAAKDNNGMVAVAKAFMLFGQALTARASCDCKDELTDEAQDLYEAKLLEVNAALDSASPRVKQSGPWHYLKLRIAFQHRQLQPSAAGLFRRAIASWPDSLSIYGVIMEMATPSSGGSFEQVDSLARLAAEKSRAKWGDSLYALLYQQLFGGAPDALTESNVDWDLFKQGIRDFQARHGGPKYVWKNFAVLACQMRDRNEAQQLYDIYEKENGGPDAQAGIDPCRLFAFQEQQI